MKVNEEEVNVFYLHKCQLKAGFEATGIWEIRDNLIQSRPRQTSKILADIPLVRFSIFLPTDLKKVHKQKYLIFPSEVQSIKRPDGEHITG